MRLLILGASALSLSACTVGGVGFGSDHSGYESSSSAGYGSFQSGRNNTHPQNYGYDQAQSYGSAQGYGPAHGYDQSQAYTHTQTNGHTQGYGQSQSYGQAGYAHTPSPCQPVYQSPCAAAQQPQSYGQPHAPAVDYAAQYQASQSFSYLSGYPVVQPQAPEPTYAQNYAPASYSPPATQGCAVNACDSYYGVSSEHAYDPTNPYAYGSSQTGAYGHSAGGHGLRGMRPQQAGYLYGTVGAVLYDTGSSAAGVQARLGYQSGFYLGAEIEGSLGVLEDSSTANVPTGGGGTVAVDTSSGVENSYAGFGMIRVPVGSALSVHGRVGYHQTKTYLDTGQAVSPNVTRSTNTFDGVAFGGGVEFDLSAKDAVRVDFTRYKGDTQENDSVALAYLRRF